MRVRVHELTFGRELDMYIFAPNPVPGRTE